MCYISTQGVVDIISLLVFLPRFKIFDIQYYANTEFSTLMEYYNNMLLTFFVLQSYSLHDGGFNNNLYCQTYLRVSIDFFAQKQVFMGEST